jgi:hypothetical protein
MIAVTLLPRSHHPESRRGRLPARKRETTQRRPVDLAGFARRRPVDGGDVVVVEVEGESGVVDGARCRVQESGGDDQVLVTNTNEITKVPGPSIQSGLFCSSPIQKKSRWDPIFGPEHFFTKLHPKRRRRVYEWELVSGDERTVRLMGCGLHLSGLDSRLAST